MATQAHRWVVDSIEEFVASIEIDGSRMAQLPRWILPRSVREGDVLAVQHHLDSDDESRLNIVVDRKATKAALDASARQTRKGERQPNDPGGDVRF